VGRRGDDPSMFYIEKNALSQLVRHLRLRDVTAKTGTTRSVVDENRAVSLSPPYTLVVDKPRRRGPQVRANTQCFIGSKGPEHWRSVNVRANFTGQVGSCWADIDVAFDDAENPCGDYSRTIFWG
jgi:hypothetical protein